MELNIESRSWTVQEHRWRVVKALGHSMGKGWSLNKWCCAKCMFNREKIIFLRILSEV